MMTKTSQTAWLASSSLAELIDKIPSDLLRRPPIDIEHIAMRLGARKVVRRSLQGDGLCYPMERGAFVIILNETHSPQRQRFTCAHEVSHILLDPTYKRTTIQRQHDRFAERLESACDQLASEILMPRKLFSEYASSHAWQLSSIPGLASCFQTSMEATARRYVDTINEPCALLTWKLTSEGGQHEVKLRGLQRNHLARGRWFEVDSHMGAFNSNLLNAPRGPAERPASYQRIRITQGGRQSFDTMFVDTLAYGYGPNRRVLNAVYPGRRITSLLKHHWANDLDVSETSTRSREARGGQPA